MSAPLPDGWPPPPPPRPQVQGEGSLLFVAGMAALMAAGLCSLAAWVLLP